jgi:hypothetical protein
MNPQQEREEAVGRPSSPGPTKGNAKSNALSTTKIADMAVSCHPHPMILSSRGSSPYSVVSLSIGLGD